MARLLIKIVIGLVMAWAILAVACALALRPSYSGWGAPGKEVNRYLLGDELGAQATRRPSAPASPASGMAITMGKPGRAVVFVGLVDAGAGQIDGAGEATPGRNAASLVWTLDEAGSGQTNLSYRVWVEHTLGLPPVLARGLSHTAQAWAGLRRLFAGPSTR